MERLTSNIVGPDGPPSAKVAFIGQAPGAEENLSGKPFVGQAGDLLNRVIKSCGLLRSQVYARPVLWQIMGMRYHFLGICHPGPDMAFTARGGRGF